VLGEDLADGGSGGRFNLCIGIDEGQVEPRREPAAHGGLTGTHEPDQHDAARAKGVADLRQPLLTVLFPVLGQS
jgi:hypothetical protein